MKNYKAKYKELKDKVEKDGLYVIEVSKRTLADFAGMNEKAGKIMGFNIPKDTIYVEKSMSYKDKYETLNHEIAELELMEKGHTYWKAHRTSLRNEGKGG